VTWDSERVCVECGDRIQWNPGTRGRRRTRCEKHSVAELRREKRRRVSQTYCEAWLSRRTAQLATVAKELSDLQRCIGSDRRLREMFPGATKLTYAEWRDAVQTVSSSLERLARISRRQSGGTA